MTHAEALDALLHLHREALVQLGEGAQPALEGLAAAAALLRALGPVPLEHRARLAELGRLNTRLSSELQARRGAAGARLERMEHGRRGLRGYRSAIQSGFRGAQRGRA